MTVTEERRSPDLQVLVMTHTSDPRTGESTYRLLSISRAEPNLSWFEVPADYTVKEAGIKKAAGLMEHREPAASRLPATDYRLQAGHAITP